MDKVMYKSNIEAFVFFCHNYDCEYNWLTYIVEDCKLDFDHFKAKFLGYCNRYDNSAYAMMRLYTEMSTNYRERFDDYVLNYYNKKKLYKK